MNLAMIEMEPEAAQEAFRDYRRAVTGQAHEKLGEARREYERLDRAVMRGYRELANGHSLLELSPSLARGGEVEVDHRDWQGNVTTRRLPALAVCRADASRCLSTGINHQGGVTFYADDRWSRARKNLVSIGDGTFDEQRGPTEWFSAIVPTIPPPFRPQHSLSNYHILWEAEWTGSAPVDPALLKHLGGDLYAILAVWDLTDLERAVLAGRPA